jgi:GGDEF domain-containing protein
MVDLFIIGAIVHFCALGLFLVRYIEANIDGQFEKSPTISSASSGNGDVVGRLRDECFQRLIPEGSVDLCLEAADEVERLRVKVSDLQESLQGVVREAYRV